jgi:malate dehydrogenase (oxaloacetate-decarboxylating)(NADP+)
VSLTKQDALDYHRMGRPGKIEVIPTKPLATQRDLSLAYSPGVAEAVLAIDEDPSQVFELTAKGNLVAVVSNGTAILGLGDRGAMPAKPVMEGKGVLFKRFADVDVFDIEIDARTPEEVIAVVRALAPTFGGINLEDIKAPECFEIEETLRRELDIPVFHDDQHGTAIISGAALLNAVELIDKKLEDLKIVISGAGASAIATGNFYVSLGVRRENITMVDSRGVVYEGREEGMNPYKVQFAARTGARTLADAMAGADMVLGLSMAGVITGEMVATMARDPLIFVLANPTPEIMPEEVYAVRTDAIVATGRSDYSNQVNNVLGFPFIFRGALDTAATEINEAMKMAAAQALAALAREDVPDSVLTAYGQEFIRFGRDYLIPKPLDPRVLLYVAPAVARAAMESGAARRRLDLDAYREHLVRRQGYSRWVRSDLIGRARAGECRRITFAEGAEPKVVRAAYQVQAEGIGTPVLLGNREAIRAEIADCGLDFAPEIVDPAEPERHTRYAEMLYALRRRKGMTLARADKLLTDPNYFGPMMILAGDADAFISGLSYEYPEVIRPALQIVGTRADVTHAAGLYIVMVRGRVIVFADATVNIQPDPAALAEIAILAADFARGLGLDPRAAMLSFSNFGSTRHPEAQKVRDALELVRRMRPDLAIDGEMQADTAVVPEIIDERYPFSQVKDANVLIFPNLAAANIAYKLLERLTEAETIGPILLGMGRPVHVLQAGADVEDIVAVAAVAAIDAEQRARAG